MNSPSLITPLIVKRISHAEFCSSFFSILPQIEAGIIFLVSGNPKLREILESFVEPTVRRGRLADFRQDIPRLYNKQLVQRAIINDLPLPPGTLVDSTLRLRRTVGPGAFVGPHIDVHENLPIDGLNFWISFSQLEKEEAIQFLPPHWILDGIPVGHFKAGVYRDKNGKVLPIKALEQSAVSTAIAPTEYLVFYSGRTAHCSPFFVKGERITADQRLILYPTAEHLKFGSRNKYYPVSQIDWFDGSRSVSDITNEFWRTAGQHLVHDDANAVSEMANNLHAAGAIAAMSKIGADDSGVADVLRAASRSIGLRTSLLKNTRSATERNIVARELINLTPENPFRVYPGVISTSFPGILLTVAHKAKERSGLVASAIAIAVASAIWIIQLVQFALPQRIRIGILNKLCWKLWEQLNGSGQLDLVEDYVNLELNKFKRALILNRDPLTFLPDSIFRFTRTPRFNRRARSIIRALNMLRFGISRSRSRLNQVAEFGVARGEGFRQLMILTAHYCAHYNMPLPHFYAFDTFSGMPPSSDPSDVGTWKVGDYPGDKAALQGLLNDIGFSERFTLKEGLFSESLPTMSDDFAPDFVLIDCDYYTSTRDVFLNLKDRLSTGTIVYFDDLGTNFYNPNLGEERLIHEVNRGDFGKQYYLHPINDVLYFWSNAEKLVPYSKDKVEDIPLKRSGALGDFY